MPYDRDQVCASYIYTFCSRTDVYAMWTPDGWRPVREPVTPGVVYAALTKAGPSLSGYFPALDGCTHVAALDFDLPNGFDVARHLAQVMHRGGAHGYVEESRRGAHLWVMGDTLHARVWRRALRGWMQAADIALDPKIELRPVADTLRNEDDALGSALRMPMMPHPKTGKAYRLLGVDGQPLGSTISETVLAVDMTPADVVLAAAEAYRPPLIPAMLDEQDRPPRAPGALGDDSASEILRALWGVPNARPGHAVRCPAHDDRNPSLSILPDDRRAICHSPSCLLHNAGHGMGTYQLRKVWYEEFATADKRPTAGHPQ
jgi:hypothetical protein